MRQNIHLLLLFFSLNLSIAFAQTKGVNPVEARLPGKGLAQHSFLYCGKWQNQSFDNQTM